MPALIVNLGSGFQSSWTKPAHWLEILRVGRKAGVACPVVVGRPSRKSAKAMPVLSAVSAAFFVYWPPKLYWPRCGLCADMFQ